MMTNRDRPLDPKRPFLCGGDIGIVMTDASADIRHYGPERPKERHGFVQIVLPLSGHLLIDVEGRQDALSTGRGVFINRNAPHTQEATAGNCALVVDIDDNIISERARDRFATAPFLDLSQEARPLVSYMRQMIATDGERRDIANLWAPMLVETLADARPAIRQRLRGLAKIVKAEPFFPWTISRLASFLVISDSRLHALFLEEFGLPPHRWLAGLRMNKVCALLDDAELSIADIALQAGFSDQTALTRAMRNATGLTPAAYRRRHYSH